VQVSVRLLNRELAALTRDDAPDRLILVKAAFLATVFGPEAPAVMAAAGLDPAAVAAAQRDAGPPWGWEPRRLGEDFVALLLPGHAGTGFVPDDALAAWATSLLERLLSRSLGRTGPPAYAGRCLRFLAGAQRWAHVQTAFVNRALERWPRLGLADDGASVRLLATVPEVGTDLLRRITGSTSQRSGIEAALGDVAVLRRAFGQRAATDAFALRNDCLTFASRAEAAGLWQEALAAVDRALTAGDAESEATDSGQFTRAQLLMRRAAVLRAAGRADEAVTAARETISLWQALTGTEPEAGVFIPGRSIQPQGSRLRYHDPRAVAEEAVAAWRLLAEADRQYQPELGRALGILRRRCQRAKDDESVLRIAEEEVALYRSLAADGVAPDEMAFADALDVITMRQHAGDDALRDAEQAVALWRRLAERDSAHDLPLGRSLRRLGVVRDVSGADPGSVLAEAVELLRRVATGNPAAVPDLALALTSLSIVVAADEEARGIELAGEAAERWRDLAVTDGRYRLMLARSLTRLAELLSRAEEFAAAERSAAEAIELYRAFDGRGEHDSEQAWLRELVARCRDAADDPTTT
jgi:tetratricopeptide (TPR) repeat protein